MRGWGRLTSTGQVDSSAALSVAVAFRLSIPTLARAELPQSMLQALDQPSALGPQVIDTTKAGSLCSTQQLRGMGQPFEGGSPAGGDEQPVQQRSGESDEGSGEEEEGLEELQWVLAPQEEWEDPSADGVLTEVLRAAEEGDADALPGLLDALSVSVDTLVSIIEPGLGHGSKSVWGGRRRWLQQLVAA